MKILLIRFSSAGDVILAERTIAALKASGHTVYFLTKDKFTASAASAGADTVVAADFGKSGELSRLASWAKKLSFDAVIDLQGNYRSFIIKNSCYPAAVRTAPKDAIKRRLMTAFKWFLSADAAYMSVAEKYLLAAADFINPSAVKGTKVKKKKAGLEIVVHAGARWANKRWPYFKELLDGLRMVKGAHITLTGVKDEVVNLPDLLYYKKSGVDNRIGKTDFTGLLGIIRNADIFIGNDTAAAHAAYLFGLKCLVFLGPTVRQFGFVTEKDFTVLEDKSLLCRPCHLHGGGKCPIGTFECMRNLKPEIVLKEITKLTRRGK
jgi:ADP-heptose:LPS heptosyltransferase